ncbi:MAG: MFS transporter [Propionibacteriaceae bacterium]|jgi:MFS family permease|nr:MFS transporter [Propionibacteriaceae bacterium]
MANDMGNQPDGGDLSVQLVRKKLLLTYLAMGLILSSWYSRIPSVQMAIGLGNSAMGMLLFLGALGSLLMVIAAGPLVGRFGGGRMLYASTFLLLAAAITFAIGVCTGSAIIVGFGIILNGSSHALTNVPANIEAAGVERRMRRTVMPQFHAVYALGSLLGALIGSAFAALGIPFSTHFAIIGVLCAAQRLWCIPGIVQDSDSAYLSLQSHIQSQPRKSAWLESRTLLIGISVFAFSFSGGSANNWLSVAVVEGFCATEAYGGLIYAVFQTALSLSRWFGTQIVDRMGRVNILYLSAAASALGVGVFCLAPSLPLAALGVTIWGVGSAMSFPIGVAAAADNPLLSPGRVSVVSAFASVAGLCAPAIIGLAGDWIGVRPGLLFVLLVLAVGAVSARANRTSEKNPDA